MLAPGWAHAQFMTDCDVNEDILSRCLLAFRELADAREDLDRVRTTMQRECAAAHLRLMQQRWRSMLSELRGHCDEHMCGTPDTDRLFRDFQASPDSWPGMRQ